MLSTNKIGSTEALATNIDQFITSQAQECQDAVQKLLTPLLAEAEAAQASLSQRIVTDRLQDEGTAGLPNHHPLHWFQSQLEFQLQGLLEYPSLESAQAGLKEILDQLKPQILKLVAESQTLVSEVLDREVLALQQSLSTALASQLQSRPIVISEYINSYVHLPRLKMRSVDRFRYTLAGKRWESPSLIMATQKNTGPWYLLGLGKKDRPSYQISTAAITSMVDESVARAFRHMREQISAYIEPELHDKVERLLANAVQ
jgi:hypothetical protein